MKLQEEEQDEMIKQVEDADARSKHGESWVAIQQNEGSSRGNSREDRINKWCYHFHNLLGKVPDI